MMKSAGWVFFIGFLGLGQFGFADSPALTLTPTSTPTIQPIPGQEELEKAKGCFLSQTAATTMAPKYRYDQYEQDKKTARSWFERAKDRGNAEAELFLYVLYDCNYSFDMATYPDVRFLSNSLAAKKDQTHPDEKGEFERLYGILKRSAEQGNREAQYLLGFYYLWGKLPNEVPIDRAAALKWMRLAADQGLAAAEAQMGMFYNDGCKAWPEMGLTCDEALSRKWFEKAAAQGNRDAQGVIERLDTEGMVLDKKGLLSGIPIQIGKNSQPFELDEPITFKTRVLTTLPVTPPRPTKRFKDYVEIKGSLHWEGYSQSLKIESLNYIEDHGKHLLKALTKGEYTPDVVNIKFKKDTPEEVQMKILPRIGEVTKTYSWGSAIIKIKKGLTVEEALKILIDEPSVEYAEPNYIFQMDWGFHKNKGAPVEVPPRYRAGSGITLSE